MFFVSPQQPTITATNTATRMTDNTEYNSMMTMSKNERKYVKNTKKLDELNETLDKIQDLRGDLKECVRSILISMNYPDLDDNDDDDIDEEIIENAIDKLEERKYVDLQEEEEVNLNILIQYKEKTNEYKELQEKEYKLKHKVTILKYKC